MIDAALDGSDWRGAIRQERLRAMSGEAFGQPNDIVKRPWGQHDAYFTGQSPSVT